jgi:hypothetical protein
VSREQADDRYQQLYGLRGHPYQSRTLNAMRDKDDRDLLISLDGFPSIREIEDHVDRAGESAAAFLISGRNATGRTSLANAILHCYLTRKGLDQRFVVVVDDEPTHNDKERAHRLLVAIRNGVSEHDQAHDKELEQILPPGEQHDPFIPLDLQYKARQLATLLDRKFSPPLRFGLLVEGLQNASLIGMLETVFKKVPTVVVVTHDRYEVSSTADLGSVPAGDGPDWALRLHLPPLDGSQVCRLTDERWKLFADTACPFELDGVRRAFDSRVEPVGRQLRRLAWLLRWRLHDFGGDVPWPADAGLGLPGDWIETMLQRAESAP